MLSEGSLKNFYFERQQDVITKWMADIDLANSKINEIYEKADNDLENTGCVVTAKDNERNKGKVTDTTKVTIYWQIYRRVCKTHGGCMWSSARWVMSIATLVERPAAHIYTSTMTAKLKWFLRKVTTENLKLIHGKSLAWKQHKIPSKMFSLQ